MRGRGRWVVEDESLAPPLVCLGLSLRNASNWFLHVAVTQPFYTFLLASPPAFQDICNRVLLPGWCRARRTPTDVYDGGCARSSVPQLIHVYYYEQNCVIWCINHAYPPEVIAVKAWQLALIRDSSCLFLLCLTPSPSLFFSLSLRATVYLSFRRLSASLITWMAV